MAAGHSVRGGLHAKTTVTRKGASMSKQLLYWLPAAAGLLAIGCSESATGDEVESSYSTATDKPIALVNPADPDPEGDVDAVFTVEEVAENGAHGHLTVHGELFTAAYDALYQQPGGGVGTFVVTHGATGRSLRLRDNGVEVTQN